MDLNKRLSLKGLHYKPIDYFYCQLFLTFSTRKKNIFTLAGKKTGWEANMSKKLISLQKHYQQTLEHQKLKRKSSYPKIDWVWLNLAFVGLAHSLGFIKSSNNT